MKKLLLLSLAAFGLSAFAAENDSTVFFSENFDWMQQVPGWKGKVTNGKPIGDAIVEDDGRASCKGIATLGKDKYEAISYNGHDNWIMKDELLDRKYDFVSKEKNEVVSNPYANVTYMCNFLKFGATNKFSGIVLPANLEGQQNVKVSFIWCPQRDSNHGVSKAFDQVQLGVYVKDGDTEELAYEVPAVDWGPTHKMEWIPVECTVPAELLASATADTKIVIRPVDAIWNNDYWAENSSASIVMRWYLDNVKVENATTNTAIFADDFEWMSAWTELMVTIPDVIYTNTQAGSPALGTPYVKYSPDGDLCVWQTVQDYMTKNLGYGVNSWNFANNVATLKAGKADGYSPIAAKEHQYLKFGTTNNNPELVLPSIDFGANGADNVTVSFLWCAERNNNNDKVFDKTDVVVVIDNGVGDVEYPGTPVTYVDENNKPITSGDYAWHHVKVDLGNVKLDKDSKIKIRNSQSMMNTSGRHAFFLDNLVLAKKNSSTAISEIAVDENTPAEYYNLQGVKVENPANGLYIKVRGSKAEKVFIK